MYVGSIARKDDRNTAGLSVRPSPSQVKINAYELNSIPGKFSKVPSSFTITDHDSNINTP